jgi:hypothetical protein
MIEIVICWTLGLLIVLDLLTTWFKSEFPAHVFRLLWRLGWRRGTGFWPPSIKDGWDREEWVVWINLVSPFWGELLTCPICLSRHLAWMTSLVLLPFWGMEYWAPLLAGVFTWSGAANRILK